MNKNNVLMILVVFILVSGFCVREKLVISNLKNLQKKEIVATARDNKFLGECTVFNLMTQGLPYEMAEDFCQCLVEHKAPTNKDKVYEQIIISLCKQKIIKKYLKQENKETRI